MLALTPPHWPANGNPYKGHAQGYNQAWGLQTGIGFKHGQGRDLVPFQVGITVTLAIVIAAPLFEGP